MLTSTLELKLFLKKKKLHKFCYRVSELKVIHSPPQAYPRFTLPSVATATESVPPPDWSNLQEHN